MANNDFVREMGLTPAEEQKLYDLLGERTMAGMELARTAGFLSQDQVRAFEQFQEQQLRLQEVGIKMAQEMFGGKPDADAGAAVNPAP